jgi:hypothetical protein
MVQFGRQVQRRFGPRGLVIALIVAAAALVAGVILMLTA